MVADVRSKTITNYLVILILIVCISEPSLVDGINTARVVLSNIGSSSMQVTNIMGREITFPSGKIVREFLGIPYAQPPIGERRFR